MLLLISIYHPIFLAPFSLYFAFSCKILACLILILISQENTDAEEENIFAQLDLPKVEYPLEVYHMVSQVSVASRILLC